MKRILVVVVALIVYGSLYPWQFHGRDASASAISVLLHSWPDAFDRFFFRDLVINVVIYIPFGAACYLSLAESRSRLFRWCVSLAAAAALSFCVEIAQQFDTSRVSSLFDALTNIAGAAIGVVLASSFPEAISHVIEEAETFGALRLSGVVTLLYLWIGAQLFPFFPALNQTALRRKLHLIGNAPWQPRDFFEAVAMWLAVAALFETLAGKKRLVPVLGLTLLTIPLQLLIADRTITVPQVTGALLGVAAWLMIRRRGPAGIIALAALIAAGLLSFHWNSRPQTFTWIPFLPMLRSPWIVGLLILLRKSFLYGAAIWLLAAGRLWALSISLVTIALALVEVLQMYLPGHTPEITDPLLAVIVGCSVMLLERQAQRA